MRKELMARWLCLVLLLISGTLGLSAQNKKHQGFDPKRFEMELEQYITTEAGLTPGEAAKFFPVYRQMMRKMRTYFDEMRRFRQVNPHDDRACAEAIRRQDQLDIELKLVQQEYHSRFMMVLSPHKALRVIQAEEKFHRQAFRQARVK